MNSSSDDNRRARFATTSWSLVSDAAVASGQKQEALAQLFQLYWYPLYGFVRHRGMDVADAEDVTQSFFAEMLAKNTLQFADQTRGKFRTFLLTSLDNFLKNQWRKDSAMKRGGNQTHLALDFGNAEKRYQTEPVQNVTPETIFDRNWALTILEQALETVGSQYAESGKAKIFKALNGFLTGAQDVPYAVVADELDMKEGAIKVAVHRLRERFGQQLRLQVARTVSSPEDVDDELRTLLKALGAPSAGKN